MKISVISLIVICFIFSNVAGILACNFTKRRNPLLSFFKCVGVFFCFFKIFVSSHSEVFNKVTVLHLWLKYLKESVKKFLLKLYGSEALLKMNSFTCILMILTTSGLGGAQ